MKALMFVAIAVLFVLVMAEPGLAQGAPPLPVFPNDPAPAPIDGGLGLLAAAGAGYAYKKLREKKS